MPCLLKPSRSLSSLINFSDLNESTSQKETFYLQIYYWYWKTFLDVAMLIFDKSQFKSMLPSSMNIFLLILIMVYIYIHTIISSQDSITAFTNIKPGKSLFTPHFTVQWVSHSQEQNRKLFCITLRILWLKVSKFFLGFHVCVILSTMCARCQGNSNVLIKATIQQGGSTLGL